MNELSLETNTLAELHTGLAQCFEGYKMPSMNFGAQAVVEVGQNLDVAAQSLSFN